MRVFNTGLVLFICLIYSQVSAQAFLNLDFEYAKEGKPLNWITNGTGFEISVDTTMGYLSDRSLHIKYVKKIDRSQVATAVSRFPVDYAKGKTIIYSGFIKTKDLDRGFATLWLRVDGKDGVLKFENLQGQWAVGTNDWKRFIIKVDVDPNAVNINFGVTMAQQGEAWFDYLQFEIDGKIFDDIYPAEKK